ncbi:MAG: hypothetical protein QOI04_829 [Verrucomicrobiota bacterium]|jgi:hypothetical protein
MNIRTLQTAALVTAVAIAVTGLPRKARASDFPGGLFAGIAAGIAIAAVVSIIAQHEASERQRRIAQQRAARCYVAHKSRIKQHKARYIAVDTEKDGKSSSQAKKTVMIWDTQSQQVVGNEVYDVKSPPPVGSTAKFEGYQAEYVGSGS